jgi:nucleotide-binding universal stress UspA family protein
MAQAVVEVAANMGTDLIILGTALRAGSERLYLGPRIERILSDVSCPVVIFNVP